MELIAALLGAVVGGAISAVVSWWHTRRAMRHEFELFREGLAADRQAARVSFRRAAAVQALQAISALDAAMPHMDHRFAFLGRDVPGYVHERRARAEQAIDELRRAQVAALPLLGDDLRRQWEGLTLAADAASRVDPIGGDESVATRKELARLASLSHRALVDLAGND